MNKYYKPLALLMMMATLALSSCSPSKDEPTQEPPAPLVVTKPVTVPGGLVNGANGYVEPYHDPAYPNSPYFTHQEAAEIQDKLINSGSEYYVPSANELVHYFPRPHEDGTYDHYLAPFSPALNTLSHPSGDRRLLPDVTEFVEFEGHNTYYTKSRFLHSISPKQKVGVIPGYFDVIYAIRFYDQPEYRVFQRWTYSFETYQHGGNIPTNKILGTISFLPYEESATVGGKDAPVFTEEYWERRASEVKSVSIMNWGWELPDAQEPVRNNYGFVIGYAPRASVGKLDIDSGFALLDYDRDPENTTSSTWNHLWGHKDEIGERGVILLFKKEKK